MFGFHKKSHESATTTIDNNRSKKAIRFGAGVLALAATITGGVIHANSSEKPADNSTPAISEPAPSASIAIDTLPDTSYTATYTIPSSEVASPVESSVSPSVSSEITSTSTTETPISESSVEQSSIASSSAAIETPTTTSGVSSTAEIAPTTPSIDVPVLSVAEYENQPAELIRAFVEKDLQAWANAGADADTVAVINDRIAQGEDLDTICADLAKDNAAAFAPALFGDQYEAIPSIMATVDNFTEINAKTLQNYFKTADSDTAYLTIITGISPKVYDEDAAQHLVQGAVSISIASNGNDTSLGADETVYPVSTYNVLFEDATNSGNYTVTGMSK